MSRPFSVQESPGLRQALHRPAGPALPVVARSLTAEEVAAMESKAGRLLLPILLGMLWLFFLLPLLFGSDRQTQRLIPILFLLCIAGTGLVVGAWFWRQQRRRVHCATPIRVEVGRDGIAVLAPGQVHLIPHAEAAYKVTTWTGEDVTFFLGILLETPIGPLHLQDGYFENGTDAADAILRLCGDDTHLVMPRMSEPRTGPSNA